MFFLNLILAGGLAAISAPIIVHFIHRNRVQSLDWGAMMFLDELLAKSARRIKLQEWLLLLVRALIIACLVLAMMRPIFKNMPGGALRASGGSTSAMLLLDDSYSMKAGHPHNAWHSARELALRYVDTLHKGDNVTVLFTSSSGKGLPPSYLLDLDRAREIIRGAAPRYEKMDMPFALDAAIRQLDTRPNARRELVVISDMQSAGWNLDDRERWSALTNLVAARPVAPNIILASVAEECPSNIALTELRPSRVVVDCYSSVDFKVTVVNGGPVAASGISVSFSVDGAPKTTRTVGLQSGAREVLSFPHKFEQPGSHYVSCRLRSAQDALPDDDELVYSVSVVDRLPVLLVDGDRQEQVLASESGFLKMALSPKDNADPAWRTVIEPVVIDTTELRYTDLTRYQVIVLMNLAALPTQAVAELERFVVGGGGLLITLGNRVRIDAYNRDLYRQGAGLLPVQLVGISEGNDSAVHLGNIVSSVPSLELFQNEKGPDWSRATISRYFSTTAPNSQEDARTIVSFSNGATALVQKKLGEGKVVLLTTAADRDWSDLPLHPFYVPLMQNLVQDLASTVMPPRNLAVNQVLSHVVSGALAHKSHVLYPPIGFMLGNATGENDLTTKRFPLAHPLGHSGLNTSAQIPLRAQNQGALSVFSFENTEKPGLYTVVPEGAGSEKRTFYVVTTDRSEAMLGRLKKEHFKRFEQDLGARHASDWTGVSKLIGLGDSGIEVSKFLIMAAIFFCFLEIYLTRRWA